MGSNPILFNLSFAYLVELVDTIDLKSISEKSIGSSPIVSNFLYLDVWLRGLKR